MISSCHLDFRVTIAFCLSNEKLQEEGDGCERKQERVKSDKGLVDEPFASVSSNIFTGSVNAALWTPLLNLQFPMDRLFLVPSHAAF